MTIINTNSLARSYALDQLSAELDGYVQGVAIVTETHLKARHDASIIRFKGFSPCRRDYVGRCRGGVAVLVKDDLPVSEVTRGVDDRLLELL